MERYNNTIQESNGDIITTATVTVYLSSTGAVASIFADNETSALNNPFTVSDSNYNTDGSFWFKAANGLYDIKVNNGSDVWVYDENLFDYDDRQNTDIRVDGVLFGADTAAANTLDDYEEGYWTAGFTSTGGTITINSSSDQGSYTKVGRLVTVQGKFSISSVSSPTGDFRITGLPFTPAALNENAENFSSNVALGATASNVTGLIESFSEGGTSLLVREGFGTTTNLATLAAKIDAGTSIYVSAIYYS